jgi:hypothetical protein
MEMSQMKYSFPVRSFSGDKQRDQLSQSRNCPSFRTDDLYNGGTFFVRETLREMTAHKVSLHFDSRQ